MEKWDEEEKLNDKPCLSDIILHPKRINFIFIDEKKILQEQFNDILDQIQFCKTNIISTKTW